MERDIGQIIIEHQKRNILQKVDYGIKILKKVYI